MLPDTFWRSPEADLTVYYIYCSLFSQGISRLLGRQNCSSPRAADNPPYASRTCVLDKAPNEQERGNRGVVGVSVE